MELTSNIVFGIISIFTSAVGAAVAVAWGRGRAEATLTARVNALGEQVSNGQLRVEARIHELAGHLRDHEQKESEWREQLPARYVPVALCDQRQAQADSERKDFMDGLRQVHARVDALLRVNGGHAAPAAEHAGG